MSVPAAFIGVVIIWSTTPLAIKWSSDGAGFLFGVSARMFITSWLLGNGRMPAALPAHALWSIVYLGVVGSVVGFVLYYYVLRQEQASRVALITLMTPVIALILGQWLNEEIIGTREWLGTLIILAGLAVFEWGGQWQRLLPARG